MKIYGSRISYYTGKLEAYLRYRGIAYELLPTVGNEKRLKAGAGVVQMPVVELGNGRWMTDSTPIINWLDKEEFSGSVYPTDDALNFLSLLIEDYADEWLWRPAMHYRWSYPSSKIYASEILYRELIRGTLPIPRLLALRMLRRRQFGGFVKGDGVNQQTLHHVEQSYFNILDCLQTIFKERPFILGDEPTIADFGMMGPMFRHFSMDPDPANIMRQRAPDVYEWVARMWNVNSSYIGEQVSVDDPLLKPLLKEICATHLIQLTENAKAYSSGHKHFSIEVQGCTYRELPVSRYRVWCLEELRKCWASLSQESQAKLKSTLSHPACPVLWETVEFAHSNYDLDEMAPFNRGINVYGSGIPKT